MSPYASIPEKVDNTLPQLKSLLPKPLQETEKVLYHTLAMKQNIHRTTCYCCTVNSLYY